MMGYFKSIGIVATLLIFIVFTVLFIYFTYLIAIGLVIISLIFIVKFMITSISVGNSLKD